MTDDLAGAKPSPDAQWLRAIPGRNHLGRLEAVVDEVLTMRPRRIMQGGSRQRFDGNRTMEAGGAANQSDLPKRRIRVTGNAFQYKPGRDVVKEADVSLRTCHRGVLCQECPAAPETRRRPETSVESALAGRAGTLLAGSEAPTVHGARLEPRHVCPGPPLRVADAAPRLNRRGRCLEHLPRPRAARTPPVSQRSDCRGAPGAPAGVAMAGDVATLPRYFLRAIRWVEYKKVLAEPMVSCRFRLDQAKEAFDAFAHGGAVKVLFEM